MTDAQLVAFAREFRDGILDGRDSSQMCAAVCWPLASLLATQGVRPVKVEEMLFQEGGPAGVSNHVIIRLPDGRILDPTADQFGLEPVYLGELPELYTAWMLGRPSPEPPGEPAGREQKGTGHA